MADAPKSPTPKAPEPAPKVTTGETLKALDRTEKKTGRSGAVPKTPKQRMYNIDKLKAANPDKHYRYVNVDDAEKAQGRIESGYKTVPEKEAEEHDARTQIGSTRLMELPRDVAEERTRELDQQTRGRLKAHKRDVEQVAEAISKELRDKHGIDIPTERLMVDE